MEDSQPISSSVAEADAVSQSERKGPLTMSLVWLTMVASFPSVLIGFEWYNQHFSFIQVVVSLVLSVGLLLLYSVPICTIAINTGLSFKFLGAKLFDKTFARCLTLCLIAIYLGWYAVLALFMADACCGVMDSKQYMPVLAFVFSFAMAINNFFGFRGVANFARFVGAPAVICWVIYMFIQVSPQIPICLAQSHDVVSFPRAFWSIATFIIGFAVWGNEADYWRNGISKPLATGLAIGAALFIGEILFPLTGWIIAAKTGITDSAIATAYLNNFAFGKAGIIAVIFVGCQYFAANDSNLYAFAHGVESFTKMTHQKVVLILAILAAFLSAALSLTGTAQALESMCTLNSVLLPTATVILMVEWFFFRKKQTQSLPPARYSAMLAWLAGAGLGILTSGVIPGSKPLNVGVPALQAWVLAMSIYAPLRVREISDHRRRKDELESLLPAKPTVTDLH